MDHRKEDVFDPTDWIGSETESMVMVPADASLGFLAQKLTTKKIKVLEKGDGLGFLAQKLTCTKKIKVLEKGDEPSQNQDSRIRFCRFCGGREFKSDKALHGHLRIHSQQQAKSKTGIHHIKSTKLAARKLSPEEEDDSFTCFLCEDNFSSIKLLSQHMRNHREIEEEEEEDDDDSFACFVCEDSFSSMKLLCGHMRNYHREKESNGIQQPIPSQESNSVSETETTVEEWIDTVSPRNDQNQCSSMNLLKDIPNWSQTGKRGRKRSVSDKKIDNEIYNPAPLRVYYGSSVPQMERRLEEQDSTQSLLTRKKQKTEETMPNQDASMESESADSESTVELLGNCKQTTQTNKFSTMLHKSKSSCSHGRLKNPKRAKTVNNVHQCEICGKMFETGQALGGHKTSHRMKPVVDPLRVELVQRKDKEQLCGKSGQVREYITRMLLPGALSREADPSEKSYQEHPKRLLDFDLNISLFNEG